MTKAYAPFLAAVALLLSAAAVRADDKEKLQGEWTITAMTMNGMPAPEGDIKDSVMTFKGNKISVKVGKDDKPDEESYELGKSGDFLAITVTDKDGKKYKGIAKFEDDGKKLTLCFTDGAEFPTKFEAPKPAKEGAENILMVLKRKG